MTGKVAVAASWRPDADAGSLLPRVLVGRTVVIDRQGYENVLAGVTGFIVPRAPGRSTEWETLGFATSIPRQCRDRRVVLLILMILT